MEDQTALFNQYENEYCNKSTDISRKINAIANLSGELRRKKIMEVEADIKEADSVIRRMDMEARSLAPEKSKQLQVKVREYKADYNSIKEQLKKAAATASTSDAARAELELGVTILQDLSRQRETILHARHTLHGADDNLGKARKILSNMSKRIMQNKIIMFGIAAFLILGIVLILAFKFGGKRRRAVYF